MGTMAQPTPPAQDTKNPAPVDPEGGAPDAGDEAQRINSIVSSRIKREMKAVNSQLAQMAEMLKKFAPPSDPDDEDDDSDDAGEPRTEGKVTSEPKPDIKAQRRLTRLERELAEERKARAEAEKARSEEAERAKRNEMRSSYSAVLTELGVTSPRLLRAALDQLDQDGIMTRDEDGKIRFKGLDKYGIETLMDPKVGLRQWVSSEGKEFLPAVEASGSGQNPRAARRNGGAENLTPVQKARMAFNKAFHGDED